MRVSDEDLAHLSKMGNGRGTGIADRVLAELLALRAVADAVEQHAIARANWQAGNHWSVVAAALKAAGR